MSDKEIDSLLVRIGRSATDPMGRPIRSSIFAMPAQGTRQNDRKFLYRA
jgi:hypothetical protein